MNLARTPEEIVARVNELKDTDWMGTQRSTLIIYLEYEQALPFFADPDKLTKEEWDDDRTKVLDTPVETMRKYLDFAWDKANNCRGLSAGRSLDHMAAWTWLMGATPEWIEQTFSNYKQYGKLQLALCNLIAGRNIAQGDNGLWVNNEGAPTLTNEQVEDQLEMARVIFARLPFKAQ